MFLQKEHFFTRKKRNPDLFELTQTYVCKVNLLIPFCLYSSLKAIVQHFPRDFPLCSVTSKNVEFEQGKLGLQLRFSEDTYLAQT